MKKRFYIYYYELIEVNTNEHFGYYDMNALKKYLNLSERTIDYCIRNKWHIVQENKEYTEYCCYIFNPKIEFKYSIPDERNILAIQTGLFFINEEQNNNPLF